MTVRTLIQNIRELAAEMINHTLHHYLFEFINIKN